MANYLRFLKSNYTYILVFLLFFIPRIIGLGSDINNYDGAYYWHNRIYDFAEETLAGNYVRTYQQYHPGVTVMWLAGFSKYFFEESFKYVYHYDPHFIAQQFVKINFVSVLPLVFVISLLGVFHFWAIKKLINLKVAWWYVVLLSFEPFFLGVSRFLHLTALSAMFMFAAFLSMQLYTKFKMRSAFYYSAIFCGLAVLTRIDGALAGIAAFGLYIFLEHHKLKGLDIKRLFKDLFIYGLIAVGVFVLLFPAMWVEPFDVASRIIKAGFFDTALQDAGDAPNFGLGVFFYPLFILFRSSVFLCIAFVLAFSFLGVKFYRRKLDAFEISHWVYFLFLMVGLTFPGKMIDRYVVYFYPSIVVLCALFLTFLMEQNRMLKKALPILFIILTTYNLYAYYPVYSFFYSEALLGAKGFEKLGYDVKNRGEYYAQAAAYLNQKTNSPDLNVVLSHREQMSTFGKFFYGKTYTNPKFLPDGANVDYIITRPPLDHLTPVTCKLEKIFGPKWPYDYPIIKVYKCENINNLYKDFKN